jgi:hypothetical protein
MPPGKWLDGGGSQDSDPAGGVLDDGEDVVGAENYVRRGHGGLTMVRDLAPAGPFRLVVSL